MLRTPSEKRRPRDHLVNLITHSVKFQASCIDATSRELHRVTFDGKVVRYHRATSGDKSAGATWEVLLMLSESRAGFMRAEQSGGCPAVPDIDWEFDFTGEFVGKSLLEPMDLVTANEDTRLYSLNGELVATLPAPSRKLGL